jgi:chorismate dehydratase
MAFRRRGLNVWDMASLWNEHTGLGFVFAMWMVRDEAIDRARLVDFSGARDEGVAHLEDIVASYQDKIPMRIEELRNYLTRNIVFNVDESMEKGLRLYFELAFKHRLIDSVKPLTFISDAKAQRRKEKP